MTSARDQFECALRLAVICAAVDEVTPGYLLSEERLEAIMAAADRYRAAGQPAVTAPARGGSRMPAPRDGSGGIPGHPRPEGRLGSLSAERERIVAGIITGLVEGS